jgi:c-di-GMP-binding flagellar brake protein YcgR
MATEGKEDPIPYVNGYFKRRRHHRYNITLPVEYWVSHDSAGRTSHAVDISEGGLKVYLPGQVKMGQPLRLNVSVATPLKTTTIETLVEVAWRDSTESELERSRSGVKFVNIAPADLKFLINFFNDLEDDPKVMSS